MRRERKKRDLASSQELEYFNYTKIKESNQEKNPCLEERDEQDRGFGTVYIQYTVRPPSINRYIKEKQLIWFFLALFSRAGFDDFVCHYITLFV